MTPKEVFDQIYELQAKLNRYIGRDTLNCPSKYHEIQCNTVRSW